MAGKMGLQIRWTHPLLDLEGRDKALPESQGLRVRESFVTRRGSG